MSAVRWQSIEFPNYCRGFQSSYPDIFVDLTISDRRIDPVAEQIDVTIRVGPMHDSSLIRFHLGEVRRSIVASPAYLEKHGTPRHPRDLQSHNCLSLTGFAHLSRWPMLVDGQRMIVPVTGTLSCDSADVLFDLAIAGVGISRVGDFLATTPCRMVASCRCLRRFTMTRPHKSRR